MTDMQLLIVGFQILKIFEKCLVVSIKINL